MDFQISPNITPSKPSPNSKTDDVIGIIREERQFSDKVGLVFDKLVTLLANTYDGAQISFRAEGWEYITTEASSNENLKLYEPQQHMGGEEVVDETSFLVVYFKGAMEALAIKLLNVWRGVFQSASEIKEHNMEKIHEYNLYMVIELVISEIWGAISWFFNELKDGAEDTVGSKVEPPILEVKLCAESASETLPKKYIDQVVALDIERNPDEKETLRQACANKFTMETVAKADNSLGTLFQSAMFYLFPVFGLFQSDKNKRTNLETYYGLEALFGGAAAFSSICERAGINNEFKEFYYLPWTKEEIASLVRCLASGTNQDLQNRLEHIQARRGSIDIMEPVQKHAPTLLKSHKGLFYDIWNIARYSLSINTHFMNVAPDVSDRKKGVNEGIYQQLSLMQDYESEYKANSQLDLEKQCNDFYVSFAQEGMSQPFVKKTLFFTPSGILQSHKSLHKAGATVYWYQPLNAGINHLFGFTGMKISDSTSAEDWFSRLNVFNEKMGDNSYQVIKTILGEWLASIKRGVDLGEVNAATKAKYKHYEHQGGVTLLAKSLGTTFAQRLFVDYLDKAPIKKAILVAGTGIEETEDSKQHTKFAAALESRPDKWGKFSLHEYRDMEDPVPTVGGNHLPYLLDEPHSKLDYYLNLYSRTGEITEDSIPKCKLKDTSPDSPDYQGWFGSIAKAFAHLNNIWTVLMEIARFNHLGQFHRYVDYTIKSKVPHEKHFVWSVNETYTNQATYKQELNKYLVSPSGWNQRRLKYNPGAYHSVPNLISTPLKKNGLTLPSNNSSKNSSVTSSTNSTVNEIVTAV